MDYFEGLICTLLEAEGYWIRRSHKVNLSKEEKRDTGKISIPRPEIDILAFDFEANTVIALEVKSYLDSPGVKLEHLQVEHELADGRFKLFTAAKYRQIVLSRLKLDLIELGMANKSTTVKLGLASGKIQGRLSHEVRSYLAGRDIFFWSPEDIKEKITKLADSGYQNDPATLVAKVLLR